MTTINSRAPRLALFVLALGLILASGPTFAVPLTAASDADCTATWGSLAKQSASHYSRRQITDVRSGRHACFDRLVIDLNSAGTQTPGFGVRYVRRVVADGSGKRVPLRGGARLQIVVNASVLDDERNYTYRPEKWRELVNVDGYQTFRQVAFASSFEGQTIIGLGVRARLPMRVFRLPSADGGHRVVVDVAHRW